MRSQSMDAGESTDSAASEPVGANVDTSVAKRMRRWLLLAAVVALIDQLTKWWVVQTLELGDRVPWLPFFSWVRWHNEGAAFSLLSDAGGWQRWFFIVLGIVFVVFIVTELRRMPARFWWLGVAYGLILGGAIGNLWDRVLNGYVVDFVLLHWREYYFPAFNVADSALTVGAVLWIVWLVFHAKDEQAARDVESDT